MLGEGTVLLQHLGCCCLLPLQMYVLLVVVWVGAVVTVSVAMTVDVVKQTVVAVLTFGLMAELVWQCLSLTASCCVMPTKYFTVLWCLYDEHVCALALGISSNSYPCTSA